jgi:hypothetical protein
LNLEFSICLIGIEGKMEFGVKKYQAVILKLLPYEVGKEE